MEQTATEWVIEQIRSLALTPDTHLGMGDVKVTQKFLDELMEKANQLHRDQVMRSFIDGVEWPQLHKGTEKVSAKFYYRDTYGG
jgi:hypothetical protein